MAANEPITIHRGEQCHVSTNGTIYQGVVKLVFTNTVCVEINGMLHHLWRKHARRTRLQRLIIEVTA